MYIYIYICIYNPSSELVGLSLLDCACMSEHTCKHARMPVYMYTRTHIFLHTHTCTSKYIFMHTHTDVGVNVCMHI